MKQIAGQIYIVFPPFSTVNYVLLFLLFIADFFFLLNKTIAYRVIINLCNVFHLEFLLIFSIFLIIFRRTTQLFAQL